MNMKDFLVEIIGCLEMYDEDEYALRFFRDMQKKNDLKLDDLTTSQANFFRNKAEGILKTLHEKIKGTEQMAEWIDVFRFYRDNIKMGAAK